ncbi:MAG: carbohydrate ABC transporter substrate-binding protein [Clostridiales bacterium]|nr:carbohydrate ABC transporter substrate-binding protein [Clostridiales bacterium]
MKKRAITLILLAAFVISAMSACGNNDTPNNDTEPTATDPSETTPDTAPVEALEIPDVKYDDYAFRIFTRPGDRYDEVYTETENGEVLNDAVYRRNAIVEEKLGITFEITQSSADWETEALNSILANDDEYDVIIPAARAAFIYAQNLVCTNWFDLPYVDLTKSWWNQDAVENLTINGKLYVCDGDISPATLKGSVGMIFNKQLLDDYKIDYPYELVTSGKWTFDEFSKIVKNFSQDLNSDGNMTIDSDLFGYASSPWCGPINALYCTGERIITVDKDGYPQLTLYSEKTVDMYDKYLNLLYSENGYNAVDWREAEAFCDGRVAMIDVDMRAIATGTMREAKVDFGLVPWPKADESVDKYYSYVDAGHSLWIVPITNPDLERTSVILEAMAYYGQKEIIPAYYNITLQNKYLRDDESVEMLDYIKDGGVFDLGYYNDSQFGGGLANPGYNLVNNTTLTFTTLYNQYEQSVKTLIEKSMKVYLED